MSRIVPPIPITLDKATPPQKLLKCDFNAIALIKEWTGLNVFKGDNAFKAEIFHATGEDGKLVRAVAADPSCLRAVLAALLFEDDENMTPLKAGRLIHAENYVDVLSKCAESVQSFFGDPKKKSEAPEASPLAQTDSTSPTSGPLDGTTSASQSANSGA